MEIRIKRERRSAPDYGVTDTVYMGVVIDDEGEEHEASAWLVSEQMAREAAQALRSEMRGY